MSFRGLFVWFAAVSAFSIASRLHVRGGIGGDRCSLDGVRIEPVRRVDLVNGLMDAADVRASFCSIGCAQAWPDVPATAWWQVRDEVSGRPIDAARATFVASGVDGPRAPNAELHAFEHAADAESHRRQFGGAELENPLKRPPSPPFRK